MLTVRKFLKKINIEDSEAVRVRFDEALADHSSFRVGGPAAAWIQPRGPAAARLAGRIWSAAASDNIRCFILGAGANVVFADAGFPGIIIDTAGLDELRFYERDGSTVVEAGAGLAIDKLVAACAEGGWAGLTQFSGMPGSVGGVVWMNARCYGAEAVDVLDSVNFIDEYDKLHCEAVNRLDYGYKRSPFQRRRSLITSACFRLNQADKAELQHQMAAIRADRQAKGHYRLPSAGSVFKNDYDYGQPTGQIIDELGLRGKQIGGARIADWHGNIIVNTGAASAADIKALTEFMAGQLLKHRGLSLELEIIFVD